MTLTEKIPARGVATGELYPYESAQRLIDRCKIGDTATKDFDRDTLDVYGEMFLLKPMGDVRPVIEAGGLFDYARKTGMIPG
jgi:3-isopropylmalate/(R)-2-methylmalate dehydratase small subunit